MNGEKINNNKRIKIKNKKSVKIAQKIKKLKDFSLIKLSHSSNQCEMNPATATKPDAQAKRTYTKRMPKPKERPCGDGTITLADLNIDTLELIANYLEIENFIALYLALPKGLWTADALVERRLMRQPAVMQVTRAAQMFSFLGKIQPQYLNRLCYKNFMRFCIEPIHQEERFGLIRTMLEDHTKLFQTPGSIRKAKSDFNQFDIVRRSAYLSKALKHTWMRTYQTCGGTLITARTLVEHLKKDSKNPVLFGSERLTLVQMMTNSLIKGNKFLITLFMNLSSWHISSDTTMSNDIRKNYRLLIDNLTNHFKLKYGEFKLFITLVLRMNHPWSSYYPSYSILAFRPYEIIFDPFGINYNRSRHDMGFSEFKASIEKLNQRWCEYLAVEHVPLDYTRERINKLLHLTHHKNKR